MTARILATALAVAISCTPADAGAQTISGSVVAAGGGTSSAGSYVVTGTAGQAEAGAALTGGAFTLTGGFWSYAGPRVCTLALQPAALPNGTAGSEYPATSVMQSGALGGVTYAVTGGALPAGMFLTNAGAIGGTPTQTGAFNFSITATDATGCSDTRAYSIAIACPAIALSATTFPRGTVGQAYPATAVTQSGGIGTATFAVTGGALPGGLSLSSAGVVSGTPTAAGTFNFVVTATDANACTGARSYPVTIGVVPVLTLSPSTVNFGVVNDSGSLTFKTPAQVLTLTQNGPGAVTWTAGANVPWLIVSPVSGSGPGSISVSIKPDADLPATGVLSGVVTVSASGAANSPAVTVNLTVIPPGEARQPSGAFDTPMDGQADVTGSVAVTGWAIDDVGVTRVRLMRAPVEGESQQVFIGDAVFVAGARPDVAGSFPLKPLKDQAGWGYLLLTNFLPAQGNGTFTLYAYADDVEGGTTLLGSKTITCSNATATAPFGGIDTPGQGETISGTSYVNFGWVLTPAPKAIPADGSTIQVFIDSMPVGTVNYGFARADLQQLFPGYANSDGAVGFRMIDTTALANGVHTLSWVAIDNQGAASGIGSRYFTVSNSSLSEPLSAAASTARVIDASPRAVDSAPAAIAGTGETRRVRAAQLERFVIALASSARGDAVYRGYEILDGELRALPVGSHLDAASGQFAWAPGLAFGGVHNLLFIRRDADGREHTIRVEVTIAAR